MQQWVRFSAKVAAGLLSAWFLLLPVTANALGLGNIKMESALNEPLKAEIPLLSADAKDIKSVEVKLASPQAFTRAGIDRTQLLTQIRFNIVKKNDKYVVELTTAQSIREPFLNFLVELNSEGSRLRREYTVLLDPAKSTESTQTAQAPETTPPAASQPAPAPEAAMPAPVSPFSGSSDEPSSPEQTPAAAPAQTTEAQAPAPSVPAPEPIAPPPAPESTTAAATPEPEPVATPAEPASTAAAPAPEQPFESQSADNGELFPAIPLTAYKESQATATQGPASEQAAAPTPEPAGEMDYGITKKGDNLWQIAQKVKPNNQVTIYQVMMALQQSNPKAFVNGNINRLKVGQVMRISDPSLLTAMSKAQALKAYQTQTRDWEDYLATVGAKTPRQTIMAGEEAPQPAASGVTSGQLTLSTPQSEKMGAGTGSNETESNSTDAALLEQQARKAMQEAKAQRKKNADLNAKLDDLDAELKRMENLVNVKDSDLARLQRKLDELNKQRAASEAEAKTETEAKPANSQPEAQAEGNNTAANTPQALPEPAPEPAPTPEPAKPAAEPTPPPAEVKPAQPVAPAPPAAPAKPTPPPASAPMPIATSQGGGIMDQVKGFFGGIMGGLNAMMLIIGGVVVLVLLLLIFILFRRRKAVSFQESILSGPGASEPDSMAMDANPSQNSSLMGGGESSFLSDFAISGVSAIQAEDSEVDPLTEADVFMAYGRYEAAEERLQEAITQDPDRGELRVKLLELFNTTKDKAAFESNAEDFYANLGGNAGSNPLWQKVVAMGREIAPENPLFSGGVAAPAASAPSADLSDKNDVMDIGLDTGVFSTSDFNTDVFNEKPVQAADEGPADLDFNLDDSTQDSGSEKPDDSLLDFSLDMDAPAEAADKDLDMDFNLDLSGDTDNDSENSGLDFNLDSGDEPTAETPEPATKDDLDFNLDLDGDSEPTATEIKLGMDDEPSMADLDFEFTDNSDKTLDATPAASESDGLDMNLDASDASMGLDESGGDEVGTKLDLARAYIDMGDPDGARSILDEVMEEGNDGQKQEAQQLMTQIG